jgi:hypothetical protein
MKWLVTVRDDEELAQVSQRLHDLGCDPADDETPVPLSGSEVAISVEGPSDLPRIVKDDDAITGVFNNSDIVLN